MVISKWINGKPKIAFVLSFKFNLVKLIYEIFRRKTQQSNLDKFHVVATSLFVSSLGTLHNQIKFYKWDKCFVLWYFFLSCLCKARHSFIFIWETERSQMYHCQCPCQNVPWGPLRLSWYQMLSTNPSLVFSPLKITMLLRCCSPHTWTSPPNVSLSVHTSIMLALTLPEVELGHWLAASWLCSVC